MISEEKRLQYVENANKKRREKYSNDAEYRQKRLDYNKKYSHKFIYDREQYLMYKETFPEKIKQFQDNQKKKNNITVENAKDIGNHRKRWTAQEELVCAVMYFSEKPFEEIATVLNRSIKSVDNRVTKIRKEIEDYRRL